MGTIPAPPVRAALVGSGMVGQVHARAIRVAGAQLVGVLGSTPERSARAAAELGAERAYASIAEVAEDPRTDVVHVCTPNHLHHGMALAALRAGKHVVCEKPLATTSDHCEQLVEAARAGGLVGAVPFVYRYYALVREARARLSSTPDRPVHAVHGSYLQDWLLGGGAYNWRVDPAAGGPSRAFADIGSHWCDAIEFVTGHRIDRVVATLDTTVPVRTAAPARTFARAEPGAGHPVTVATEDLAALMFRTDRGATGSLFVSQVSAGRKNRLWFQVDTAEQSVVFDQEAPETLLVGSRDGFRALPRGHDLSAPAAAFSRLPAGHPQGYQECFDRFVSDTYEVVRGGEADGLPSFADGLRAARITDAVLASAAAGTWVEVAA